MKNILSIAFCMLMLAGLPSCKTMACKKDRQEEAPRTEMPQVATETDAKVS